PGYGIEVKGSGKHVVRVRFRVPVAANGDDRELQFGAPRLAQNRLTLTAPEGAAYLQCPTKQGAASFDVSNRRLEAELGRITGPLQLRWRQEPERPVEPEAEVRELPLWDLGVSSSTLTTLLHATVTQGALPAVEVDLPDVLEVRAVEVAAPRAPAGP